MTDVYGRVVGDIFGVRFMENKAVKYSDLRRAKISIA